MNERTRKLVVYSALALAIIWGTYNFLPKSESPSQVQNASIGAIPDGQMAVTPAVEKTIDVAEMKNKSWGADPFRAVAVRTGNTQATGPIWKLTGIIFNQTKPMAIINGKVLTKGERINDATVVEISPKTVIIEYAGATMTLRIKKDSND